MSQGQHKVCKCGVTISKKMDLCPDCFNSEEEMDKRTDALLQRLMTRPLLDAANEVKRLRHCSDVEALGKLGIWLAQIALGMMGKD